jgi:gluconolactonase
MTTQLPETLPPDLSVYASEIPVPEGPAWGPDGLLYFVSASQGLIYRAAGPERVEKFADTGGRPNGLAFAPDGTLFVADAGRKAILRVSATGSVEVFADKHESRPFGGPNDLAFLPHGEIIFTDPARLPLPDPSMSPIFIADPDGEVRVFVNEMAYPNGVDMAADGKGVFIAEMRAHRLVMFNIDESNAPLDEKLVRRFREPASPDGMAVDVDNRVFLALPGIGSLALVGADGALVELFHSPKWKPSNVAFGGEDMRQVFVTSESDSCVYTFRHNAPGVVMPPRE